MKKVYVMAAVCLAGAIGCGTTPKAGPPTEAPIYAPTMEGQQSPAVEEIEASPNPASADESLLDNEVPES